MKTAIISLLLSSMFLLPAQGFAQQSSDDPAAAQAPVQQRSLAELAREQKVLIAVRNAAKALCSGKLKDDAKCKLAASNKEYSEELVRKTVAEDPDIQSYIRTGVLPEKPVKIGGLLVPDKSDADTLDLDKSWMGAGLTYQQHEAPSAVPSSAKSLQSAISDAESAISKLEDLSARQLGDNIVHNVQFPDRPQWERRLFEKKNKVVAAARAYLAVARSTTDASLARSAKYDFDIEMVGYNDLVTEGIAKASDWERRQ
jgi:hypothetical protein